MATVISICANGNGAIDQNTNNNDNNKETAEQELLKVLNEGIDARRVKYSKLTNPSLIFVDPVEKHLSYAATGPKLFLQCSENNSKRVSLSELLEVRQGYSTDGLHKAAKHHRFQNVAPEDRCFSVIFKHPKFVCKAVDFVANEGGEKTSKWIEAIRKLLAKSAQNAMTFDEKLWILKNFRMADLNRNGEVEFDELWRLMKKLNLQLSEPYVRILFKEVISKKGKGREGLNETEFLQLFGVLTDMPEFKNALRLANGEGNEFLDAKALYKFLTEEQDFKNLDPKKVEAVIDYCETGDGTSATGSSIKQAKVLSVNGFRRLLQSRWGNILKEGHESIFMDMDQPLQKYFIKSSHNTYITGIQVRGNATVEGYICALKKGSRLLEHIFDGDDEPIITHKMTFITDISLRNALKSIAQYAFQVNPYPVILTIENHVIIQQSIMADIFTQILGDHLYIPPEEAMHQPLPSPNKLKGKFILRGKGSQHLAAIIPSVISNQSLDDDEVDSPDEKKYPTSTVDPYFGRLVTLPSVKLSSNIYSDAKEHPSNGSPSLSEKKVQTYCDSNAPIAAYTATHLVKSYPSGLRQDSSNMSPIPSLICGIQSIAMNFQTHGEELDLIHGLFSINGNIGYVLKPDVLLEGNDPKHLTETKTTLEIAIICAQYLPKSEPNSDIIDPYVTVEIFGIPADAHKVRTQTVKNNGFSPVWKRVKDFDTTSSHDFIGEYSIPVTSIRPGYSLVRLNTGPHHSPDEAASIFIRVAFI